MKTNYLFPHRFKLISGTLFLLSFIFLIVYFSYSGDEDNPFNFTFNVFAIVDSGLMHPTVFFGWTKNSITDEVLMLLVIVFGIIFAFSKEKQEDEMVATIRLHSLAWSTIANYTIVLLCYMLIYGFAFLNILMVAMFSQLVIFIVLFRFRIYSFYNAGQDEE